MPTPLGDVIDSVRGAVQGRVPGDGSRRHRFTLWLLTLCRRATLLEELERGIRFAPDMRHHRADARPVVTLCAADLAFEVPRATSLMDSKRDFTAALTGRGDMAPYRFEGCAPVRFALENRR